MIWSLAHRADPRSAELADRHYSRQKPGTPQFVPPGRCLVLHASVKQRGAYWVTSWPFAEYTKHAWAGAWICSAFRNEGCGLSSEMICDAVAATRWKWPSIPRLGMVTFVDAAKVHHKRDPGRCFLKAGFRPANPLTTAGGLLAFQLLPCDMPEAKPPHGAQLDLFALALRPLAAQG